MPSAAVNQNQGQHWCYATSPVISSTSSLPRYCSLRNYTIKDKMFTISPLSPCLMQKGFEANAAIEPWFVHESSALWLLLHMLETPAELGSTTLSDRLMRSCARQRLVAASSRSTLEKVASRRGSGRHWRSASRALALSLKL